jgi:ankyrin repeat protein
MAALNAHTAVMRELVADDRVDLDFITMYEDPPLIMACAKGYEDVVRVLLSSPRCNPSVAYHHDGPALWVAVNSLHARIVKMLLDRGVDPNGRNRKQETVLCRALRLGKTDITQQLLEYGADPCTTDVGGWTPLHLATEAADLAVVKLLLADARVDANQASKSGMRPIHIAAHQEDRATLELFPDCEDVDVNAPDGDRLTPLMWVAYHGFLGHVQLLLAHAKIDINLQSKHRFTALIYAVKQGHVAVVKALLSHLKIDVNIDDGEGRSALWYASEYGYQDIAKLLIAAGAAESSCR